MKFHELFCRALSSHIFNDFSCRPESRQWRGALAEEAGRSLPVSDHRLAEAVSSNGSVPLLKAIDKLLESTTQRILWPRCFVGYLSQFAETRFRSLKDTEEGDHIPGEWGWGRQGLREPAASLSKRLLGFFLASADA